MTEKYLLDKYKELTKLSYADELETFLVQDLVNGKIVVRKKITIEAVKIYQKLQMLNSPGLAKIFEIIPCGSYGYVIEEYISGETLDEVLEKRILSEEETLSLISQLLLTVAKIHEMNIIHRDISPKNILISTDGVVKLLDFGIARTPRESKSKDTAILGTAGYAPPEQFGFRQTDTTADVYSIGVLINQMLTGKMLDEEKYSRGRLGKVIEKCTQIDPEKRYKNAQQIYDKLLIKNTEKTTVSRNFVPGFRTGKKWKEVTAVVGYAAMLFVTGICVSEYAITVRSFLLESLAVLLYIWIPFLLCANFLYFDQKIWPLRQISREAACVFRIILAAIVFCSGIYFDGYLRNLFLTTSS